MSFTGMILAPSSHVTINGTGMPIGSISCQIIGDTVHLTGDATTVLEYQDEDSWDPPFPPQIEFIE
jgi:hypothetical protein